MTMKNLGIVTSILLLIWACNSNKSNLSQNTSSHEGHQTEERLADTTQDKKISDNSIAEIVASYLILKNALTEDKSEDAANAGKALETAFNKVDKSSFTETQKKTYEDVEEDAREHAEHIGKNGGNIKHQREHFEMLSQGIYDLVKTFGGGQVLYRDFCPMYNNGKGAYWLSETKEIKNPYFGKEMPTCGSIKEELK